MINCDSLVPCGTLVEVSYSPEIKGMITAQFVRFDMVQYEISYFVGGDKVVIYLNENEFKIQSHPQEIGFSKNGKNKK